MVTIQQKVALGCSVYGHSVYRVRPRSAEYETLSGLLAKNR